MQEILALCVELDTTAQALYAEMAEACVDDADLTTVFTQMSREEAQHVGWWTDLLGAWRDGMLPELPHDREVLDRLREIASDIAAARPDDCRGLSIDELLTLAARLEFYMLDPLFNELAGLMQPGNAIDARKAYSAHVLRLVDAIERRHTERGLAAFLARVLQRAFRDQQQLVLLATHDQLTRQYNRRGLLSYLEQWLSWSERYSRPLAVSLIDIDNFKSINDTHGHPAGDAALVSLARTLHSVIRGSDIIGRFGGDEFMVIAPETDGRELALLLDRIVEAARGAHVTTDSAPIRLTVSAGGAFTPGGTGSSAEALIAAADSSLYAAKNAGRDRYGDVVKVEPDPQQDPTPAGP